MGLHEPFGHLQHKLCQKERMGVKLIVWLPTTKSWESTRPQCVKVECNTPLESSRQKLQVSFRPHPNQRSEKRIMTPQSGGIPNRDNFEIPPWESRDKKPFGCRCHAEAQRILYGGRWWLPLSPGPWWVLWVQNRLWLVLAPKVFQKVKYLTCWLVECRFEWVIKSLSLFLVPSRSLNMPLYPF
jgi:hypothetical protein